MWNACLFPFLNLYILESRKLSSHFFKYKCRLRVCAFCFYCMLCIIKYNNLVKLKSTSGRSPCLLITTANSLYIAQQLGPPARNLESGLLHKSTKPKKEHTESICENIRGHIVFAHPYWTGPSNLFSPSRKWEPLIVPRAVFFSVPLSTVSLIPVSFTYTQHHR